MSDLAYLQRAANALHDIADEVRGCELVLAQRESARNKHEQHVRLWFEIKMGFKLELAQKNAYIYSTIVPDPCNDMPNPYDESDKWNCTKRGMWVGD